MSLASRIYRFGMLAFGYHVVYFGNELVDSVFLAFVLAVGWNPNGTNTCCGDVQYSLHNGTYASMLISEGIPIAEVSVQLGHSSIDITLRTYAHLFTDASIASRHISDLLDRKWHHNGHQEQEKTAGTQ